MKTKKWNLIMGYILFMVGVLKLCILIVLLLNISTVIMSLQNGGNIDNLFAYTNLSIIVGYVQIAVAVISIIMVFANLGDGIEYVPWYIVGGIGTVAMDLFLPSMLSYFTVIAECGMYFKAGTKINKLCKGEGVDITAKKNKVADADWFYDDQPRINVNEEIAKDETKKEQ